MPPRFWPEPVWWACALGVSVLLASAAGWLWFSGQASLHAARTEWQRLQQQAHLATAGANTAGHPNSDTLRAPWLHWPAREGIDSWVRLAAEAAGERTGVQLRQIGITHVEGSERQAPHVQVDVSATGAYTSLKQWQAELQDRMPSLSLKQLQWQAPPNDGSARLAAQFVWQLWVQDEAQAGGATSAAALTAAEPPAPHRAALRPAARDAFGFMPVQVAAAPPPPPPPAPVAVYTPPPPPPPQARWVTVGRLRSTDGRLLVTGHWGDERLTTVAEGSVGPGGERVLRLLDDHMEVQVPGRDGAQTITLPRPPRFESR